MPQESQSNENNKSKQRFSGRRRSYVDAFRWGFVPEEADDPAPKSDTKKQRTEKPETKKEKQPVRPAPSEVSTPDAPAKSKRSRSRKKSAEKVTTEPATKPKAESKTKTGKGESVKHSPKTPAGHLSKQPVPGKHPPKGKGRTKAVVPPQNGVPAKYSANSRYDEDDEDLRLPSYGRTPIPTDDELPVPVQKPRTGGRMPPAHERVGGLAPSAHGKSAHEKSSAHESVVSDVSSSGGFRPRREQMVWDPDKSEYVPLVTKKQESVTPKQTAGQESNVSPKPQKQTADDRRQTTKKKAKSENLRSPLKGDAPKEEHPSRHNDTRRSSVPQFVESSLPDPADIEAEVSGFAELGVSEAMLEALKIVGYSEPTPIQAGVFQKVRAGVDLMGQAQTGTGKTAAFSMPIIEGVEMCPPGNDPVALILVPTRELAVQVRDEAIRLAYGRDVRVTACYGGKPLAKQIERLKSGIDVLVGTPGRILDLMNRRALSLDLLRWVVLDEADRMLDIGFRPDIEKILKRTPQDRQTLLFSATLPPPVVRLAEKYMKSPEVLDFSNKSVAVETIEQFYVTVDPERKFDALVYLLQEQQPKQAIIFTRTKRGADRLARLLSNRFDKLAAIHGDLQQNERDRVMAQVRAGSIRYLVATDVVGRGIDVSGISHIINYDVPKFCDDYVHRVGRTGRMGRDGIAFTFVTVQEGSELTRIEMRIDKLLKRAELKGFESFTKPHDPNATLDDDDLPEPPKPVFGKPVRKVRRAL
jgi:ATP-dependent RNA helicase DeaD